MATKMKAEKRDVKSFVKLSCDLTGHEQLDEDLATEYYDRIAKRFDSRFSKLLAEYAENGDVANIMSDSQFSEVAKEITMLWYMSGFRIPKGQDDDGNPKFEELPPETPEQYFRGLFWPTVRAHPLGLSGGYFGYWKYPPEN